MTADSFSPAGDIRPSAGAVVVAAGMGVRMGAGVPKALMALAGRPLVAWAVAALDACPAVGQVVVVAPPGHEDAMRAAAGPSRKVVATVPGGSTRSRSVALGLAALPPCAVVAVHDAARPLAGAEGIAAVIAAVEGADGAIAAAPLADTVKREDRGAIAGTVDRAGLWLAQTPQAFRREVLAGAFAAADEAALDAATDCAWLVERAGGRVRLVDLGAPNLKVTTPSDVALAEALLGVARG